MKTLPRDYRTLAIACIVAAISTCAPAKQKFNNGEQLTQPLYSFPLEFTDMARRGMSRSECIEIAGRNFAYNYKFIRSPVFVDTNCKVITTQSEMIEFLVSCGWIRSKAKGSDAVQEIVGGRTAIGFHNEGDGHDLLFFDTKGRMYGYRGDSGTVIRGRSV